MRNVISLIIEKYEINVTRNQCEIF